MASLSKQSIVLGKHIVPATGSRVPHRFLSSVAVGRESRKLQIHMWKFLDFSKNEHMFERFPHLEALRHDRKLSEVDLENFNEYFVAFLGSIEKQLDHSSFSDCVSALHDLSAFCEATGVELMPSHVRDPRFQALIGRIVTSSKPEEGKGVGREQRKLEILQAMQDFSKLQLRAPLRDLGPHLFQYLRSEEDVPWAAKAFHLLGRGMVYHPEFVEFLTKHHKAFGPEEASLYAYECGRHGLRCKHLVDQALPGISRNGPKMDLGQMMRASLGLCKFIKDWAPFFEAIVGKAEKSLGEMTNGELGLMLRVCKEQKHRPQFLKLQSAVTRELRRRTTLTPSEMCQCLMYADHRVKYGQDVRIMVKNFGERLEALCPPDPEAELQRLTSGLGEYSLLNEGLLEEGSLGRQLSVTEMVDALDCFSSWGIFQKKLWTHLLSALSCRLPEVKYSPNVSLWQSVTSSCSLVDFFHPLWISLVIEMTQDRFMVDKISFWQIAQFMNALGKLHFYDRGTFSNCASLLKNDLHLFKSAEQLGPLLWNFAKVGEPDIPLFEKALDFVSSSDFLRSLESGHKVLGGKDKKHSYLAQLLWCFCVSGYINDPRLSALLEGTLASATPSNRGSFRRLSQICELLSFEGEVGLAQLSQGSRENVKKVRENADLAQSVRAPHDPEHILLIQKMTAPGIELATLMNAKFEAGGAPHPTCPVQVDLRISRGGKEVNVVFVGSDKTLRSGKMGEQQKLDSGMVKIIQQILEGNKVENLRFIGVDSFNRLSVEEQKGLLESFLSGE